MLLRRAALRLAASVRPALHSASTQTPLGSSLQHSPHPSSVPPLFPSQLLPSRHVGILVELGLLLSEEEEQKRLAGIPEKDVIRAVLRSGSGKIAAKKERRMGRVPSIVFEQRDGHKGGHKTLISVEAKQVLRLLRKYGQSGFLSRTYDLMIEREDEHGVKHTTSERVIPRLLHLHCSSEEPLNVTFMRAPPSARFEVDIPLSFVGEDACPGIRKGGHLNTIKRKVRFSCPADLVPPTVEVDLSTLDVGGKILLRDLQVPSSVVLVSRDLSLPVCKIAGSRALADAEPSESAG